MVFTFERLQTRPLEGRTLRETFYTGSRRPTYSSLKRLSKGVATHPCDCPVEPARWATYTGCPTAETSDTVVSD